MESDIVQRLRDYGVDCHHDWIDEAADEIERLRAELAAMRQQRDEARREAMQWWRERFSTKEFKEEVGQRGWEYLLVEGGGA